MPRNTIKSIRLYRGTTQQHSDYAGPVGEITVDTEKYTVVVQNGVTGGVPLARESDVTAEAQAREAADTALQKSVTDEVSAREAADTAIQKKVTDEASARVAADNALQKKVTDEASARMAADTTLQHNLTNEASARDAADITLRNNLTNEIHVRETADTALQKSITDEASARETADNAFQKQIDDALRRGAVIGEVRWFAMSTPPEGWLVCNGATVGTSDYVALFAAIGKTFTPRYLDESLKIEDPRYSDPTVFRLPNLMGKVPWGSSTQIGIEIEAGLPDINGAIGGVFVWGDSGSGVFSDSKKEGPADFTTYNPMSHQWRTLDFKASNFDVIYGKSSTVQPPALCLLPCIRYE